MNPKRRGHLTQLGPHLFVASERALIDWEINEENAGQKARCATDH